MSKHESYEDYPADSTKMAETALLTAWDGLAAFQSELSLVGGLAIRYLTHPPESGLQGPVTMDVDFGIQMGASSGQYSSIKDTLRAHGFKWTENQRFEKQVEGTTLYIDLLTDDEKSDQGTIMIDDGLQVAVLPGIQRALELYRKIKVSGDTMIGAPVNLNVRVAEVGPMLVLKLNAFGGPSGRKTGKDAHDILYLAMNYLDGAQQAIAGFQAEVAAGNRGTGHAIACLREYFLDPNAQGPISCAAFRLNNRHLQPDLADESLRIRQQCVTLAEALLHGI
ncbi:hypothetical protein QEH56_14535 [Pelagicoccus enzymogenes]|uniref:hypothetical protein n=1 Tax=Pelagicoccus enzymogenes TaxID=2773457 RepID=UPI00280DA301|nr:hypothetical protein [Pelagicoccus enzymogenes]MDQ8199380.1 hypothetical protein [Pelagicoccus enzymogenes]